MYRKPGGRSVLCGVPSGPYTGGARQIDVGRLEPATRTRIARAVAGRDEPSAILGPRSPALVVSTAASGMAVAAAIFAGVFAIGFAEPYDAWSRPPVLALAFDLGAGALFAMAFLLTLRGRALSSGDLLRPGKYLFPLDVVEITRPDASASQTITVRSLGDARDARIDRIDRRSELVVLFDDASLVRFPLDTEAAEVAVLGRLEGTQGRLERLTYAPSIEEAFTQDLFFDLRADESWASVAPAKAREPQTTAPFAGQLRVALAVGRAWPLAFVLALAVALGGGAFQLRRVLGERALFDRAVAEGTPEAIDVYLERGGQKRTEALSVRAAILTRREEQAAEERATRERLLAEVAIEAHNSPEGCIATLHAQSSSAHPEVPRIMETILRRNGKQIIPIRFLRTPLDHGAAPVPVTPELTFEVERYGTTIGRAFERVFSESCPSSRVEFVAGVAIYGADDGPTLDVRYDLSSSKVYDVSNAASPSVRGLKFSFDVTLHAPDTEERATFHLVIPPPAELTTTVRPRSLFEMPPAAVYETIAQRVHSAIFARAFDRLYDEIYGLFFTGDPRVPLRATSEEEGPADVFP